VLKDLHLKAVYRSESDNILTDFYIPTLTVAKSYDRAVGFFSAATLTHAAEGLTAFIGKGEHMRLIVGAFVDDQDVNAIEHGYELRSINERLTNQFLYVLQNVSDRVFEQRVQALAYLVAAGILDVRVALKRRGMYHEKIGIITDHADDQVVFQGSANETPQGLLPDYNFESINVFPCWEPAFSAYYQPYLVGFETLWNNKSKNTIVLEFPDAVREQLVRVAKDCRLPDPASETAAWEEAQRTLSRQAPTTFITPAAPGTLGGQAFTLFDHQKSALAAWRKHSFQGIMALATGAGKTITSLYAATKMFEALKRLFVIVSVPYQNLADQWVAAARDFNMIPLQCYANVDSWREDLRNTVDAFNHRAQRFAVAVVVNRTLQSPAFQELLNTIPGDQLLFIGDECHHHTSTLALNALPGQAAYRLGLSATPESAFDTGADERLQEYYGKVIARYTLAEALNDGVLTPYEYYVHPVALDHDEAEAYFELSKRISALIAQGTDIDGENPYLETLLFARARLLGSAQQKLTVFDTVLAEVPPQPLSLFYCGDGRVADDITGDEVRQIDAVSEALFARGWKTSQFTARETLSARRTILDNFRIGDIDALVAIRCLDEGIDIPGCATAFLLASARSPRQFIQRRGRILRKAPGKSRAYIHDFLVYNPFPVTPDMIEAERKLMDAELARVNEFANTALNPYDAERAIANIPRHRA
jgi:superfamily II DNA or RNA helicase